jgi:hypothetical protein
MLEKMFNKANPSNEDAEQPESLGKLPYEYESDFDVVAFRRMEDEYIRLGYMGEEERMQIPAEIEEAAYYDILLGHESHEAK